MQKHFLITTLLLPFFGLAQNVGVGTTTPTADLEVKSSLHTTLKISSAVFTDTSEIILSNRNTANQGTDFIIRNDREQGLFFSSESDLPANTAANSLVIKPNGNVGIGGAPLVKFHVNGASRYSGPVQLEGLNLFEFGSGVVGKEINAGKIGYNAFGTNALAIVGAGTNSSNRAFYVFAEGGSTFNGPVNIGGALQVAGNPGTAGQVLHSNGAALPVWRDAAFQNSTRFSVLCTSTVEGTGTINITSTQYNLNPADITIGSNTITVNKSGLYHFTVQLLSRVLTTTPTSYVPETTTLVLFNSGATTVNTLWLSYLDHYLENNSNAGTNGSYYYSKIIEGDVYLTSGMTIRVNRDLRVEGIPSDVTFEVSVLGYLIAE